MICIPENLLSLFPIPTSTLISPAATTIFSNDDPHLNQSVGHLSFPFIPALRSAAFPHHYPKASSRPPSHFNHSLQIFPLPASKQLLPKHLDLGRDRSVYPPSAWTPSTSTAFQSGFTSSTFLSSLCYSDFNLELFNFDDFRVCSNNFRITPFFAPPFSLAYQLLDENDQRPLVLGSFSI